MPDCNSRQIEFLKSVLISWDDTCIESVCFLGTRLDDPNATAGNIPKSQMESTEFIPDDEEHAIQTNWILPLTQKAWIQSEANGDLCRLIEIGLQDRLIENHDGRHDECVIRCLTLFLISLRMSSSEDF